MSLTNKINAVTGGKIDARTAVTGVEMVGGLVPGNLGNAVLLATTAISKKLGNEEQKRTLLTQVGLSPEEADDINSDTIHRALARLEKLDMTRVGVEFTASTVGAFGGGL